MKKCDFFFEDLMFSLRCGENDAEELTRLGKTFIEMAQQNRKSFSSLSSKNLIFLSAILILAQSPKSSLASQELEEKSPIAKEEGFSFNEDEFIARLSVILQKIKSIKNLADDDLFEK